MPSDVNKTFLSLDKAEVRGLIHRDYIAHCFRWSHAFKHLLKMAKGTERLQVLDVGCGREMPLAKTIFTGKLSKNVDYLGIDAGKIEPNISFGNWSPTFLEKSLFPDVLRGDKRLFQFITCFEVIEHMGLRRQRALLAGIQRRLTPDGIALLSTPCYNADVGAAGNHVNELTHDALGFLIEEAGLVVTASYGTFASQRDYKEQLVKDGYGEIFERLSEYYQSEIISTMFAPLYPRLSRNCLWHVKQATDSTKRKFKTPGATPHGSATDNIQETT